MSELLRRIRFLLNRRRFDQELTNDMEFHREMAARNGGVGFGNSLRLREESREAWGWTWIDRLGQDLRYAGRMLRKSPGFTIAAVLMLAVGVGVNVAAFGFFNLMVLRPLPVKEPETVLRFQRSSPRNFADNFPYPEVAFFRNESRTLSAVWAISFARFTMDGAEKPIHGRLVTANFFKDLGAIPRLGRMLDPARDEAAGAEPVVVLDEGFWQSRFGADPSVVGKVIRLDGKPVTVVGVVSGEFSGLGLDRPEVWAPITQKPYFTKGTNLTDFSETGMSVLMWGRVRTGLAPKVAEEELRSLAAELHRQHPKDIWENESLQSDPGGYAMSVAGPMYPVLGLAAALGLLIFLAACGNLSSLLLARGLARGREMAIRVSVGAGPARLIRQLFTESLALALLGSAAGLVLGYVVLRSLLVWADAPAWLNPLPDWRVTAFAIGIGFAAAIVFGLAPALNIARQRHRTTKMRQALIGAQVAASCVLLIVAGLLVRALNHAGSTTPGFDYQQVISIDPSLNGYSPEKARLYFDALENRLRDLPGVESVALVSNPPLGNRWTVVKTEVAGRRLGIHFNNIDPAFFQTMTIPLLRGRNLKRGDTRSIVVSDSLARLQWPAEDPIGKQFSTSVDATGSPVKQTVVGVVGSARLVSPEDSDAVEVYQLAQADLLPSMVLLVKTSAAVEGLAPVVATIAKSIDPDLFPEVQLMKSAYQRKLQIARYSALSVSVLGYVALLLACGGIIGLVAFAVSQRTKEIGVRMALGAKPAHVLSAILRQFSVPVAIGLLAGGGGAAALSQVLRQQLYGVSNLDPLAYIGAIGVFAGTVAVAALLPARRALRVDPMQALRED
jgi:predicted permease